MNQAGVYIHIPFCRARCSYCDFATGQYEDGMAERYVRALVREIHDWNHVTNPEDVDTIYFGGGTPSLLTPLQISEIITAVRTRFRVVDNPELTIEMNPASVVGTGDELSNQKLDAFRQLGINRASFGAQSFDDHELKQLGRTHTAADIPATLERLRQAGFENINFDLIAGLPGQTVADWEKNLANALGLGPEHLSLYLLDVHEGTPLADQISRGTRPRPDDDLAAEMYRMLIERMTAAGYEHYEISNFCRPGFESRHNSKYWTGAPYYGFGCSASSYDGARRRWSNERDTAGYVSLIENAQSPVAGQTSLAETDVRSESIFLGLRLMRGIDLDSYQARFGISIQEQFDVDLARLKDAGLIEIENGWMRLTSRGAVLSNEVMVALL